MSDTQRDEMLKLSKDTQFQKAIKAIHAQTQIRQLDAKWVFAGSGFTTATLDLAIESSATNDTLMFEAFTERMPPVGSAVTMELVPVFKKAAGSAR